MIYFISDTHFNHKNIIKYCNRHFDNVEQMNETLIKNWNEVISNTDTIYHLGDFALGNKDEILNIFSKLNGNKYLIRGNHDKWSANTYENFGFNVLKNAPIRLDEYKLLLSHIPVPDIQIPKGFINIHGHIHNKKLYECIEKYDPKYYSLERHINISCDVTDFKPISIEKLIEITKSVQNLIIEDKKDIRKKLKDGIKDSENGNVCSLDEAFIEIESILSN